LIPPGLIAVNSAAFLSPEINADQWQREKSDGGEFR